MHSCLINFSVSHSTRRAHLRRVALLPTMHALPPTASNHRAVSQNPSGASHLVGLEHAGQFATQNITRYDDGFPDLDPEFLPNFLPSLFLDTR